MYSDQDPIIAVATASGRGGIGIIRISFQPKFEKDVMEKVTRIFFRSKIRKEKSSIEASFCFFRLPEAIRESPWLKCRFTAGLC